MKKNSENLPGEIWKEIAFPGFTNHPIYEISNYGRVKSYAYSEKGRLISGTVSGGYRVFKTKLIDAEGNLKDVSYLIHRLVAEYFLTAEEGNEKRLVIHKDHDKKNNHISNLQWATQESVNMHNRTNPNVIRNNKLNRYKGKYKLSEAKVRIIKKQLKNQKTRPKMIAKQFGISLTQLNRISKGENWAHVKVD